MFEQSASLGRQSHIFALLLGALICLDSSVMAQSGNQGLISFPAQCNCSMSLACSCCLGVVVNPMNMTKMLCLKFQVNVFSVSVDVTVTMDGNTMSKFTLSAKTPPTFCLPLINVVTPMAVCLKMNTKLAGLTGLNVCPSFYSTFDGNQILGYDFPCIKLGMDGISIA